MYINWKVVWIQILWKRAFKWFMKNEVRLTDKDKIELFELNF